MVVGWWCSPDFVSVSLLRSRPASPAFALPASAGGWHLPMVRIWCYEDARISPLMSFFSFRLSFSSCTATVNCFSLSRLCSKGRNLAFDYYVFRPTITAVYLSSLVSYLFIVSSSTHFFPPTTWLSFLTHRRSICHLLFFRFLFSCGVLFTGSGDGVGGGGAFH